MKRDFSILTKRDKKDIKKWLKEKDKDNKCPFNCINICNASIWDIETDERCYSIFPMLSDRCPCSAFGEKYVVRVIRKAIKENKI